MNLEQGNASSTDKRYRTCNSLINLCSNKHGCVQPFFSSPRNVPTAALAVTSPRPAPKGYPGSRKLDFSSQLLRGRELLLRANVKLAAKATWWIGAMGTRLCQESEIVRWTENRRQIVSDKHSWFWIYETIYHSVSYATHICKYIRIPPRSFKSGVGALNHSHHSPSCHGSPSRSGKPAWFSNLWRLSSGTSGISASLFF